MISADDPLNWFYDQLAGLEPETTPGTPKCGYYLLRRRIVRHNDDPARRPGDPRHKVTTLHLPAAIWLDEDGCFRLQIDHPDGFQEIHSDTDTVDSFFSRMCRNAITRDEYTARLKEIYKDIADA
jgi:hypothetical protein